jgi:hypothetical protein
MAFGIKRLAPGIGGIEGALTGVEMVSCRPSPNAAPKNFSGNVLRNETDVTVSLAKQGPVTSLLTTTSDGRLGECLLRMATDT